MTERSIHRINHQIIFFFGGECSDQKVERILEQLRENPIDSLIVAGGGKCIDTGKCVAHLMYVPVIIRPALASTDAPCSFVSVMYTPDGAFDRPWFFMKIPRWLVLTQE
ncbi:MAG: iron-containing alcohol dehydrogenase [Deltaproteobacteria bacterium]|nr:iron-containing alcohol dehydrogenase [Deltaproteobacteria bacterium]